MRQLLFFRLILCLILMMWLSGGLAVADNAQSMAEMQQSLNAEVLAKPFSVAERPMPRAAAEDVQNSSPKTRRTTRYRRSYANPRLHLGFHYGRPYHHYGYGFYKGYRHRHYHRYRH